MYIRTFLFGIMNLEDKIDRNVFLKKLGFSGAALWALYTLDSCTNDAAVAPIENIVLDLTATSNAALKNNGGFVVTGGVVVAKYNDNYVAATIVCSHEGKSQMTFKNNEWFCTAHGARFDLSGKGLNSDAKKGLTVYKTSLLGSVLTISS